MGPNALGRQHNLDVHFWKRKLVRMKIAASRFKAQCQKLLDHVRDTGDEVIITKRGKPVAKLVRVAGAARNVLGCMAGTATINGDILAPAVDSGEWSHYAAGTVSPPADHHDADHLIGTWISDPETERALVEQRRKDR